MRIPFSYPEIPPLEVPDKNLLAVLVPRSVDPAAPVANLTEEALRHPFGSAPIESTVSPSTRILVLVHHITGQTPAVSDGPHYFERLPGARVHKQPVQLSIAGGRGGLHG